MGDKLCLVLCYFSLIISLSGCEFKTDPPVQATPLNPENYIPSPPFKSEVLYPELKKGIDGVLKKTPEMDADNMAGVYFAWTWSYLANAAINGYKTTQDTNYLNLIVDSFDEILKYRDSENGREDYFLKKSVPSWGHQREKHPHWWNEVTMPGRITAPICEFLLIVKGDEALKKRYAKQYSIYLKAVEDAVAVAMRFYKRTADGQGYFICKISDDEPEALNHSHSLGNALVFLYQLTGKQKYLSTIAEMLYYFKRNIEIIQGRPAWSYIPYPGEKVVPEYSRKAAVTMEFPYLAYQAGLFVSEEDMKDLTAVFLEVVYRDGKFCSSTDPMKSIESAQPVAADFIPFFYLAEFDASVYEILDQEIQTNSTGYFDQGYLSDRLTLLSYSYKGVIGK